MGKEFVERSTHKMTSRPHPKDGANFDTTAPFASRALAGGPRIIPATICSIFTHVKADFIMWWAWRCSVWLATRRSSRTTFLLRLFAAHVFCDSRWEVWALHGIAASVCCYFWLLWITCTRMEFDICCPLRPSAYEVTYNKHRFLAQTSGKHLNVSGHAPSLFYGLHVTSPSGRALNG